MNIDEARTAQIDFKAECDEAESNSQLGRFAIGPAWTMYHAIDDLLAEIERLTRENEEMSRGGIHWWIELRKVAIAIGASSLDEVEGKAKRITEQLNKNTHGASGMCCQLRLATVGRAEIAEKEVKRLTSELADRVDEVGRLTKERDEADRRAGAAERWNAELEEERRRRNDWLHKAKAEAGYPDAVSFDRVWDDILAMARGREHAQSTTGVSMIASERQRQITEEGWTPDHDKQHTNYELSSAAVCYADFGSGGPFAFDRQAFPPPNWPWDAEWWKPSRDVITNFVKAGALIAAEIDRLLAAEAKGGAG